MFLERVIDDFLENYVDYSTEDIIFVTPFRRSALFLRKIYAQKLHKVTISPEFITLDNLLERISGIRKMSDIQGLFELYHIYKENTDTERDDFEKFIGWGQLLWNDFSDIDHYLIPQKDIFPYMEAIKEAEHWSVGEELTTIQKRYLTFWRNLGSYYKNLRSEMLQQRLGYQGFIAREAVSQLDVYKSKNEKKLHIFVGFNALTKAQEHIIQYILEEMKGDIYWDIEKYLLEGEHSAGYFIKKYINEWRYYQGRLPKWIKDTPINRNIAIYGTPKQVNQVHLLTDILEKLPEIELDQTAIVLSDSDMLLPLLQSIDTHKLPINITMGYPLQQTPLHDLFSSFFKLYISGKWYHKEVKALLMQPFLSNLFSEDYKKNTISFINEYNLIYIYKKHLEKYVKDADKILIDLIFDDTKNISVSRLIENVLRFLFIIRESLEKDESSNKLNLEYLYNFYELFNQLDFLQRKYGFIENIKSLYYLYNDLLAKQKLNFRGEPLQGLQIMGILEAQNIQFKNVLVTSLNEGIFPKGNSKNSLIPFDVRTNLELPTYKQEDYVYTYYFYRILQHTNKAILFYNTDTEGLKGSEKSRFILQLFSALRIEPTIKSPEVKIVEHQPIEVLKNREIINKLKDIATGKDKKHGRGFSSSALTSYIMNPIIFYQQQILDVKDEKEVEEIVENRSFGDIIHRVLQILYTPYIGKILFKENIKQMREKVSLVVRKIFIEYQKNEDITGKNVFILKTIEEYIHKFLSVDEKNVSEQIVELLFLEKKILTEVRYEEFDFPILYNGTLDRVEKRNGAIYIVDYKTGRVEQRQITLTEKHWEKLIIDFKYSKAFQLLMYAYLLRKSGKVEDDIPIYVGNYSFKNLKPGFLGFKIASGKPMVSIDNAILTKFEEKLIALLTEIYDPSIPFVEKK